MSAFANADTEGYSRQSVRLNPAHARLEYGRAMGLGVNASHPRREEDASIQRTLRDTGERNGFFRGSARLLSHAEAVMDSDAGHPVGNALPTGWPASLSMTASAWLRSRAEPRKNPLRSPVSRNVRWIEASSSLRG